MPTHPRSPSNAASVLILHSGGTLGMDPARRFPSGLEPGEYLEDLVSVVPELQELASIQTEILFNLDSANIGPEQWSQMSRRLDAERESYDAFVIVHGTDTMAYSAAALSLALAGFGKPVVFTGSQLPLRAMRTDAKSNLLNSVACAVSGKLREVAICFGHDLLRGNRARKVHSSHYDAFHSVGHPPLAELGIDLEWNEDALLKNPGPYQARFSFDPRVLRLPIVPGNDPQELLGRPHQRGVRGLVIEAFGTGNVPSLDRRWLDWLAREQEAGVLIFLITQCRSGPLYPGLYKTGQELLDLGIIPAARMSPEAATAKLMLCLAHPDLDPRVSLAGE
ncbi:MAG: L-asparaginase 1 [Planctomycetota bacterium]|nr:MAG: L-asparaginase 1 [Planctomycetota bacterium]